jgi:uncharacterized protein
MSALNAPDLFVGGKHLQLVKRIGRGGEGDVYLLAGGVKKAVKVYKNEKRADREAKVKAMVRLGLAQSFNLVAFPEDVVTLRSGEFAGFTMRLVEGFRELHQLYGPKSRKTHYPKADFRFLVRSAANAARAVAQVHSSPCVIGDLNESGLLVSSDAMVALIDADSFQFEAHGKLYPCLVGKPDFTAPELQGQSLQGVIRTKAHDNFGLGVAVFRLLFMGRHPYAGQVKGRDLSLNEMIAANLFAYSKRRQTGVTPPSLPPSLDDFPADIAIGFERAFGFEPDKRPSALEWVNLLEGLENKLICCGANTKHFYPSTAKRCPWCRMEAATVASRPVSVQGGAAPQTPSPFVPHVYTNPQPPVPPSFPQIQPPPAPQFTPWKWIVGLVVGLWILSTLRSCMADLSRPAPSAPPQVVQTAPQAIIPDTAQPSPTTYETSFNCQRTSAWVEQQICATESLADSDRRLAGLYSSAIARAAGADRDSVRQSQRAWLKARSSCGDIHCIEQAYSDRIAFLEGWTPTPDQTTDNTGYKTAPQASQPRAQDAPPPGTITCILPYGQEMQATTSECERLGGSVYN